MRSIKQYLLDKNSVKLNITSINIDGGVRNLRLQWSPEMVQDISAFHSIDVVAELTAILSEEIAAGIDR